MKEVTETMIYDMAFRVRLYIASKLSEEKRLNDLSEREALILELIGAKCSMSISEIGNFYPKVSNSTISTTITKLWKDKKLVDKNILPENQRITTVNLTDKGRTVLEQIKKNQSAVFTTVTTSLGLSAEQRESFQEILKDAIGYFDEMLGLELNGNTAVAA
jgi:DNA-binding MarR family transcriptional regulator